MALYSEKVMDHFPRPRNVGVIEDADGIGEAGNGKSDDIMKMYLKIKDGTVSDVYNCVKGSGGEEIQRSHDEITGAKKCIGRNAEVRQ